MDRFHRSVPRLEQNEVKITSANNVRLYDGDSKTSYEGGEVVLTSHRLWWSKSGDYTNCISLPLQYIVFIEEESGGVFHFGRSSKLILHLSPSAEGKESVCSSIYSHVKLSFRECLDPNFAAHLTTAVNGKAWLSQPVQKSINSAIIKPRAGIIGIERGIQEKQKRTDDSISAAFHDLTNLIQMAKDMVELANNISAKIREKQGSITEDETIKFKSYLLSLGIEDPVTRGAYSSEGDYMLDLARQMVDILEEPIREQGGMMSLVDAYCRVNRARGLDLLSPEDMVRAGRLLEREGLPLRMRVFPSGVSVLQLANQSDKALVATTTKMVEERGRLTAEELAREAGLSLVVARERLLASEAAGDLCRDDSLQGLIFYPNFFLWTEPPPAFA